jgi:hypothetical protein
MVNPKKPVEFYISLGCSRSGAVGQALICVVVTVSIALCGTNAPPIEGLALH